MMEKTICQAAQDPLWQSSKRITAFRRKAIFCTHIPSHDRLRETFCIASCTEVAAAHAIARYTMEYTGLWLIKESALRPMLVCSNTQFRLFTTNRSCTYTADLGTKAAHSIENLSPEGHIGTNGIAYRCDGLRHT